MLQGSTRVSGLTQEALGRRLMTGFRQEVDQKVELCDASLPHPGIFFRPERCREGGSREADPEQASE